MPSARARSSAIWRAAAATPTRPPPLDPDASARRSRTSCSASSPGHCEYFASAMVVLAREIGLHARLVNGFAGGQENRIGGFVELTRSDAHTWVEVHYARAGWVRYDPTPPDLRARAGARALARGAAAPARERARAVVVPERPRLRPLRPDPRRQARLARLAERQAHAPGGRGRRRGAAREPAQRRARGARQPRCSPVAIAAGALLRRILRRRRGAVLPADYAKALRLLSRRGLVRTRTADRPRLPRRRRGRPPRRRGARLRTADAGLSRPALRRPTGGAVGAGAARAAGGAEATDGAQRRRARRASRSGSSCPAALRCGPPCPRTRSTPRADSGGSSPMPPCATVSSAGGTMRTRATVAISVVGWV